MRRMGANTSSWANGSVGGRELVVYLGGPPFVWHHGVASARWLRYSHPPVGVNYRLGEQTSTISVPPFGKRNVIYGVAARAIDRLVPNISLLLSTGYGTGEVPLGRFHVVHNMNSLQRNILPAVYEMDYSPIEYFYYYHGVPLDNLRRLFLARLEKFFSGSRRAFVTWGLSNVRLLLKLGFPSDLIDIVALPIEAARNFSQPGKETTVLFIGHDFNDKGGPTALRAFRIVRAKVPRAVLKVVTNMRPAHVSDGVECLGQVENRILKSEVLPQADLMLSPFKPNRPSLLSLLEAMAAGVPVVATHSPLIEDLVIDGETGFLVREYTPESFAKAVNEVLRDEASLLRMKMNCLRYVREHHDPVQVSLKLKDVYRSVVG